jgi:hypothetical protein
MKVLAHDWQCPKCGFAQHFNLRMSAATHRCYGPGHHRTVPTLEALRPVGDVEPVGPQQLSLAT